MIGEGAMHGEAHQPQLNQTHEHQELKYEFTKVRIEYFVTSRAAPVMRVSEGQDPCSPAV